MNNLLTYCGLVDPRISASDKDLPVKNNKTKKILWKKIVDSGFVKKNVMNSLQGSLLGAVKLSSILPWERDADIAVLSSHFHQVINLHQRNPIGKLKICKGE